MPSNHKVKFKSKLFIFSKYMQILLLVYYFIKNFKSLHTVRKFMLLFSRRSLSKFLRRICLLLSETTRVCIQLHLREYHTILTILVFMQSRMHGMDGVQLSLDSAAEGMFPALAPHRAHHTFGLLQRLWRIDLSNTTRSTQAQTYQSHANIISVYHSVPMYYFSSVFHLNSVS